MALASRSATKLSIDELVLILDEAIISESLDIGCAVIHRVKHAVLGNLILVNTAGEYSGCFPI